MRAPVRLRVARVAKVLGVPFSAAQIAELFDRLALPFVRDGEDFLVTPPSYRFDIEIEEDLIEEVARLHGYDNIPAPAPKGSLAMLPQTESARTVSRLRHILADAGYQEVVNYAFVEEAWETDFADNATPIRLANPIASQMGVMRTTLFGGLVANLSTNLKRKQSRVRVFETGRCFLRDSAGGPVEGFRQPWRLSGLAYGGAQPEQWGSAARNVDFYDVKGDLEALLAPHVARFEKVANPALHPGRSAQIVLNGEVIGVLGELHPQWVQKYELPLPPVVFELDLDALKRAELPQYAEVSRFPPVVRDLAIVVDHGVVLQSLLDGLSAHSPALIQDIRLFDVYTGKGIDPGKKSVAFRIVMQDTQRTLQDAEVDAAVQHLVAYLQSAHAAQLRV
jgi:phenylalanyl-tRNA synthetase beta chain